MGNCLMNNGVSAEKNADPQPIEAENSISKRSSTEAKSPERSKERTKKVVRFNLEEDDNVNNDSAKAKNVVRLRIVLTAQELYQILDSRKDRKHLSDEQLLDMLKVNNRRVNVSEVCYGDKRGVGWRPALESISEDH